MPNAMTMSIKLSSRFCYLNDLWSKKICRPKMIVWSGATFILRLSWFWKVLLSLHLPLYLYVYVFVFVFLCMFFMSGSVGGNGGEKAIYNPCLPTLQTIHNAHIRKLIIRCKMMRTRPSETLDYQSPLHNWEPDLKFVKKNYTTKFSGERILHTENA